MKGDNCIAEVIKYVCMNFWLIFYYDVAVFFHFAILPCFIGFGCGEIFGIDWSKNISKNYSLSDLIWLTAFFPQKVCFCLPNLSNLFNSSTTACMYKHTVCLKSAKCWFFSLGPIVKFAHYRQWRSRVFLLLAMGKFYNGTKWTKSTFWGVEIKSMFKYIHAVVLLRGLPSLEGKNELFVWKKRKKRLAKPSQTDYNRFGSSFTATLP